MKIAIVTERIEAWRGGAEMSTMELARLLAGHGHEMHIVTASRSPSYPDLTIHMIRSTTVLRPLRTATFVRRATEFLSTTRFDAVHAIVPLPCADFYQPRGGLLGETIERNIAMRRSASRRLIKRTMAAMNVKQRSLLELERAVFRKNGPTILAVSDYVARQCSATYGLGPPAVRVVFNGVNVPDEPAERRAADRSALRLQYHMKDDTLLLLFVAHNFRLKGLSPLLESLALLKRSDPGDFRLLVVGRDNPVSFRRRADSLGLHDHVIFTGPTQRSAAFYHAADVCVHPTYYDPCSRVVLEALARGLPCITTRYNGAAEIMRDGVEGFVLDAPDDVEKMAARIRELSSPERRMEMSQRARALRDRISMARHVRELNEVFVEFSRTRLGRTKSA